MPKIAKDLLKHIEDSEDECIIIEPKKKKSKKEKTKYDRGYYKVMNKLISDIPMKSTILVVSSTHPYI